MLTKIISLVFFLLIARVSAVTVSDDFTGTGALSGSWTVMVGTLSRSSDELAGGTGDYNRARWNADAFEADQYSRLVCGTYGASSYMTLSVRSSGTGGTTTEYMYSFSHVANNADVYRVVNNTNTKIVDLAETYGIGAPGDTVEMSVTGTGTSTLLTFKINGTQIFTYTDNSGSALSSGAPGVGTFRSASRVVWWQGGDYASPPSDNPGGIFNILQGF